MEDARKSFYHFSKLENRLMEGKKMVEINIEDLEKKLDEFKTQHPYHHCIVDNFFSSQLAVQLEKEFPDYNSSQWYVYRNPLENKKALNSWDTFPKHTYQVMSYLSSPQFIEGILQKKLNTPFFADPGLHGGGWHIHGECGNLNPHLDYHIHPKLGLVRKLNLIIYLSQSLFPEEHGGHFGLWEHDLNSNLPGKLMKEITPIFNRAVLFDTTQNSWHGMSRPLTVPQGIFRKSLAIYYLTPLQETDMTARKRALFAPRPEQKGNPVIEAIIKKRVEENSSQEVYRTENT